MRFTDNFRLYTPEVGEVVNSLEDSRRFLTVDRQLLGLFEVFGNGVIEGWTVSDAGGLSVSVTPGRGHIFFMSAVTVDARSINLPANSTVYIYAQANDTTRFNRDVDMISTTTQVDNSGKSIPLAVVTTGENSIESIDQTIRNDISFIEAIKELINEHRHRGGAANPSKIDLSSEVMGQLPGFRIEGIDASKIKSGRVPASVIPVLEHSSLLNSGILTHPQLDSFVRNLSNPNVRLLGELSSINMLQLFLAMKHIWNDVDLQTYNMLVMVPGISCEDFIDYKNTTATVDKFNHTIQGTPSLSGQLLTTTFDTSSSFRNAFAKLRIEVPDNDPQGPSFRLSRPFQDLEVEGFDNVFSDDTEYPDWKLEVIASGDSSTNKFVSDKSKKVDGAFSAKATFDQQFRVQITRIFDDAADWQNYNQLEIYIETLSESHGQLRLDILGKKNTDGTYEIVNDPITLLGVNETTSGFKKFVKDISNYTRNEINGLRIYTDTSLGWDLSTFVVNVDSIRLKNTVFFEQSGFIRFRLETPQKTQWAAISWDGDTNDGQIRARARTGPNYAVFDQSNSVPFANYISVSGDGPGVDDNTNIEFEIALSSNTGRTASPTVRSITISYITNSETAGLTIDSSSDFLRATSLKNVVVSTDDPNGGTLPGKVLIDGRTETGDFTYGLFRSVQQVDRVNVPVVGIAGDRLFLSPQQAAKPNIILRSSSIDGAAEVIRKIDKTYLIADTLNDRILIMNRNEEMLKCILSNNVRNITELYPIQASLNPRTKTLYIAWSTNVAFSGVDLSQIVVSGAGLAVTLSNSTDALSFVQGINQKAQAGNVTPILLSDAHFGAIKSYVGDYGIGDTRLFLKVSPDAAREKVNTNNSNFASLSSARGLPIFYGDVTYVEGIFRPICVKETSDETWLIGNARPILLDEDGVDVATGISSDEIATVIEIDPLTGEIVFSDSSVDFTLSTLGGVVQYSEEHVAVCGITSEDFPPSNTTTANTVVQTLGGGTVKAQTTTTVNVNTGSGDSTDGAGGVSSTTTTTKSVTEIEELSKYRGVVKIIEKKSGRVIFQQPTTDGTYGSDVDLDEDGNLVIIEKYFIDDPVAGTVGRGRIAKLDEDGNVFFQYGKTEFEAFNDVRALANGNLVTSS